MSRALYLFVRGLNPNPYLNSIIHCVQKKDVKKVLFVGVKKPDEDLPPLSDISSSVVLLLEKLSEGKYSYFDKSTRTPEVVDLSREYSTEAIIAIKKMYKDCYDILGGKDARDGIMPIPYQELRDKIEMIRRTDDAIFDITAAANHLVSDITAICITEGISSLYSFESIKAPQYDKDGWRTLIHQLDIDAKDKPTYRYINLLETSVYKNCVNSIFAKMPKAAYARGGLLPAQTYTPQFIYSMAGLVMGGLCILAGTLLFLFGVTGTINWSINILGTSSNLVNAAPGAILFVVGLFIVLLTRNQSTEATHPKRKSSPSKSK